MAFYSYFSTKIIMAFITKSYQNLFGVRSYINAINNMKEGKKWNQDRSYEGMSENLKIIKVC